VLFLLDLRLVCLTSVAVAYSLASHVASTLTVLQLRAAIGCHILAKLHQELELSPCTITAEAMSALSEQTGVVLQDRIIACIQWGSKAEHAAASIPGSV